MDKSRSERDTNVADALGIGRELLERLDAFLAAKWQNLTCNDVQKIYFRFFDDLKDFKGTAHGFTGLSEFLVFRLLYHQLGGSFQKGQVLNSEVSKFVGNGYEICQNKAIPLCDGSHCKPDIVICKDSSLRAVVQIKVYLTNGQKEIEKEMATFEKLRELNTAGFPALRLIYDHSLQKPGKLQKKLKCIKNAAKNDWFHYVILKKNEKPLSQILNQSLQLDRLRC